MGGLYHDRVNYFAVCIHDKDEGHSPFHGTHAGGINRRSLIKHTRLLLDFRHVESFIHASVSPALAFSTDSAAGSKTERLGKIASCAPLAVKCGFNRAEADGFKG